MRRMYEKGEIIMKRKQGRIAALFLLPYMIIFIIFRLGPSIAGLFIGFMDWNLAGIPEFAGLDNFKRLFTDEYFMIALWNTFKFFLLTLPPLIILSLLLAILLNQKMRFKSVGRVVSIIPYVLIPAVVGIMWSWMYDNNFGILNYYLKKLGSQGVPWLTDENIAIISISIVVIWTYLGYNMVLFLAGLQGIPRDLYEAAEMDGATRIQIFFRITCPMLKPVASMVITLTLVNTVQLFDQIYTMTAGGPGTSTLTMVQYLYTTAFQNYDLGYGSAIEVAILVILILLIGIQNKILKNNDGD